MRSSKAFTLIATLGASTLAIPTQPPVVNTTALPINFAILAFPGFQALDAFGPLDVFNSFSMLYRDVNMHVKVLAATLDPISTVIPAMPSMNMTHSDFGESIMPTHTFKQVLAHGIEDVDVLLVPGGGGTRDTRLDEIEFIKALAPKVSVQRTCDIE